MRKTKYLPVLVVLLSVIFFSCKKENVDPRDCTGSCKTVHLSGKVVDVSSNEVFKNAVVKAHFYQWKSTCFICFGVPVETFAETRTDNFGAFNFGIIVDANIFDQSHHYALDVYAYVDDNYILGNDISFNSYQESFSNIILTKYKKTKLTIKFKRDSIDVFDYYVADYIFRDDINGVNIEPTNQADYMKAFSLTMPDTIIYVNTAANFWTKVNGRKYYSNGIAPTNYTDSIFCNANTTNNIIIRY
jgi:hypothetical protein